ncbi:MAG: LPS export ABC transporter periplasmic protein LptC [Fibrobacterota bacterium]|nr:LPS export ABC transporter periplasmic protein LptC [Fibrobacterota bacterium]
MLKVAFILLTLNGICLQGCSPIGEETTSKGPVRELPLAEYKDTTILDMYEGSRLSWVLKTQYLVKWPRTDLVKAKPVNLIVYDSLGKIAFRITADSGTVDEGISFLVASGHVHGHSVKGVDIRSDSLRWNKAINQISTEAKVRVVSEEGDILTGKGFISDAKLDNWQILSDVKGVFQKVGERIEDAEKDTTTSRPADTSKTSGTDRTKPSIAPVPQISLPGSPAPKSPETGDSAKPVPAPVPVPAPATAPGAP